MEYNEIKENNEHQKVVEGEGFVIYSSNQNESNNDNNNAESAQWSEAPTEKPKKRRVKKFFTKHTFVKTIALAVVFGLVSGVVFSGVTIGADYLFGKDEVIINTTPTTGAPEEIEQATTNSEAKTSVEAVVENCMPAVVAITNKSVTEIRTFFGNFAQENESNGSGVIIGQNEEELLIVTNYHVIEGSTELSVVFSFEEGKEEEKSDSGNVVSAVVKGYAADKDLAVIAINLGDLDQETLSNISVAVLGKSTNLKLGEAVVAIGNALGYGQSVTEGIVSAIGRSVTLQNSNGTPITNKYIQTDAAINPGNSGGALFNMKGELIGINSAKVSNSSVEGMGYAIPISDVLPIIENMMTQETRSEIVPESERGYLGITGENVTSDISQRYGIPTGVFVNAVTEGSAAHEAGVKEGNVVTGLDGYDINTMTDLQSRLQYYRAGEKVELTVQVMHENGYVEKKLIVTLCSKGAAGIE